MPNSPLILDSGTGYLKIGWAHENFPQHSFPAMVGRPMLRCNETIDSVVLKDIMIGDEAAKVRSFLELSHPVSEGIVGNWDDMALIWEHGFQKMNVNPKQESILVTEPVMNPVKNRVKMAEVLFEKFGFERVCVGVQALMSCFAEGLMTAALLDSGDGVTHCIPVVDGFVLKHLITRMNIAGRHCTNFLSKLMFMRGYAFNSSADFEIVRELKEQFCFVSGNPTHDRKLARETTALEKEYTLPDNSIVKIGRFEAPELLFNPSLDGIEGPGCSEIVFDAINKAPMDVRKSLYESIMISGGTSMFPGFPTRLENDVKQLYKDVVLKGKKDAEIKLNIEVIDPPRRKYNVFIGSGVYAQTINNRNEVWVTRQDWEESGAACLKKFEI